MIKFKSDIKKIIMILLLTNVFTVPVLASNSMTEKFYHFSVRNKETIDEVNYYLSKGGEVKFLNTVLKDSGDAVINTMVIKIPKVVLENEPYQPKK